MKVAKKSSSQSERERSEGMELMKHWCVVGVLGKWCVVGVSSVSGVLLVFVVCCCCV